MAVTLPADWAQIREGDLAPGSPVKTDPDEDLEALAQALHKAQAENVAGVLAYGGYGSGMGVDESATATWTSRYRVPVRTWQADIRCALHVLGQNVDVRVYVGGVLAATVVCGATRQWYSSAVANPAGFARGTAGDTLVEVEAQRNTAAVVTREHELWCLEEVADTVARLPDSSDPNTAFQRVDDVAVQADRPLDGWTLGTLARNAREAQRVRVRGCAVAHPHGEPARLSSIHRRADGPYLYDAAPWESEGVVFVRASAKDWDVTVMAFSELEAADFEGLLATRAQTLTAGAGESTLVFTGLKLSTRPGQYRTNSIYLYVRSELGTAVSYSPTPVLFIDPNGQREVVENGAADWATEPQSWPVGRAVAIRDLGAPSKKVGATLSGDTPETYHDLSASLRDTTATNSEVSLSPSTLVYPPSWAGSGTGSPTADTYETGVLSLVGVYVGGATPAGDQLTTAQFWRHCAVGALPPAGVIAEVRERANEMARFGPPQVSTRHLGQQWAESPVTVGLGQRYQSGRYRFAPADGSYHAVGRAVVAASPVSGSGLNSDRIVGAARLYVVGATSQLLDPTARVFARLRATWNGGTAVGGVQTLTLGMYPAYGGQHERLTLDDAAFAAVTVAREEAYGLPTNTGDAWEHAYTQQLTWLPDAFEARVWDEIGGLEISLPSAYPAVVELEVSCSIPGASWWLICPTFAARIGARI